MPEPWYIDGKWYEWYSTSSNTGINGIIMVFIIFIGPSQIQLLELQNKMVWKYDVLADVTFLGSHILVILGVLQGANLGRILFAGSKYQGRKEESILGLKRRFSLYSDEPCNQLPQAVFTVV